MKSLVVCLALWCLPCLGLDLLRATGTYYEVGHTVGTHFADNIGAYLAKDTVLQTQFLPFVTSPSGEQIYYGYLNMTRKHFPQYVDELLGIAEGSGLPFYHLFTNAIYSELSAMLGIHSNWEKSCTDAYINYYNNNGPGSSELQVGIGHNEDGNPNAKDLSYMLHVTIVTNNSVIEDFTAFSYPGSLPGKAYGYNMHGLVLSMNAVYPTAYDTNTIPISVVLRATLAARTRDELENLLQCKNTGIGYGHNLNYANTRDGMNQILTSYEVAPIHNQPSLVYSKWTVGLQKQDPTSATDMTDAAITSTTGRYFHVNIYNHTSVDQIKSKMVSSQHRLARISQLPEIRNLDDIRHILGDTADQSYPIYRTPRPTDDTATLSTCIYDLVKCRVQIFVANPATSNPVYDFLLPQCSPGQTN